MNLACVSLLSAAIGFAALSAQAAEDVSELLKRAKTSFKQKDMEKSISTYSEAIRLDPKNVEAYCGRAKAYGTKGELLHAQADFETALKLDPNNVEAYCGRATLHGSRGDLSLARADIDTAIQLEPNNAKAHHLKALVLAKSGDAKAAIVEASLAIDIDPNCADAYCSRGCLFLLGLEQAAEGVDIAQAQRDLQKAVALQPDAHTAWCVLGQVYRFKKDWKSAAQSFDKAIAANDKSWMAFACRGELYFETQDYAAAMQDYNQAVVLNPRAGLSYAGRGLVFHAQKDETRAQADWEMARKLDPRVVVPRFLLAKYYAANGDLERCLQECKNASCIDPNDANAYSYMGNIFQLKREYREAVTAYTKAIQLAGDNAVAYFARAQANAYLGNWSDVLTDAATAARLAPKNRLALIVQAEAHMELGEYRQAIAVSSEAIRLGEKYNGYLVQGLTYSKLGEHTQAQKILEEARLLDPACPKAYACLGSACRNANDFAGALKYCNLALSHDSAFGEAYLYRGWVHEDLEQHDLAVADATEAIRCGCEREAYALRAKAELSLGYIAKAEADFQDAHLNEQRRLSQELQLQLLIAKRDFSQAKAACRRLIAAYPNSDLAYVYLARINNLEFQFAEACENAVEAIKRGADYGTQAEKAKAIWQLGRYQEAVETFNSVIAAAPNWPHGYVQRGQIRLELGELQKAIDDGSQAIRLGCEQDSYLVRGTAYMLAGDLDKAEADFQKATTITSNRLRAQFGLAAVAARRKDSAKTVEHLTKAIQIDRNSSIAFNNLAVAQVTNGELNAAITNLDEAIRLAPQNREAYLNRAAIHRRMGSQEKAADDEARAKELERDRASKFGADYLRLGVRPEINQIDLLPDTPR